MQCGTIPCSMLQQSRTPVDLHSQGSGALHCTWQCVAVCVAVCCDVLQYNAMWYGVLQCVVESCIEATRLQVQIAEALIYCNVCCSVPYVAAWCNALQCGTVRFADMPTPRAHCNYHCNTLQHTAIHFNMLQQTATHRKKSQAHSS